MNFMSVGNVSNEHDLERGDSGSFWDKELTIEGLLGTRLARHIYKKK